VDGRDKPRHDGGMWDDVTDSIADANFVLFDDSLSEGGASLLFARPERLVVARAASEVEAALGAVEQGLAEGLHAAGFLSYELGYLFERKLAPLMPADLGQPLIWMGLYAAPERIAGGDVASWLDARATGPHALSDEGLSVGRRDYLEAFDRAIEYIAAGDVYQINLTLKHRFRLDGDPLSLYRELRGRQRVKYGALLGAEDFHILSLSPELFFRRDGRRIFARPMKGTAPRGRTPDEDARLTEDLHADDKQRAENLMIVDLLRNDVGRIAEIGTVRVTDLFSVETYRTVHQMTSGIEARLREDVGLRDILQALFPCGSITGAPKLRAMEIIRELEPEPRGVYCGAIGHIAPDGDALFNVAIRTLHIGADGRGEMGIGSGVVADSRGDAEFAECLLKAQFLTGRRDPFELIETMRLTRDGGFWLLDRHVARLASSARHFGFRFDEAAIRDALGAHAATLEGEAWLVRLLLSEDGAIKIAATAIELPTQETVWRYVVSDLRIDRDDPFFYHKTTRRQFYDKEWERQRSLTGADEVLFLNRQGELAEGSRSNLFVERGGVLLTPPVATGLLAGVLRAELLASGRAKEAVLRMQDLADADAVWLGNSVRGLVRASPHRPVHMLALSAQRMEPVYAPA
jgi:para-aminobenzoate synthetase/4-amino-4-deoxychorismate lyase